MSRERERIEFVQRMEAAGVPPEVSHKIMRHATTLHRLGVAVCNGDWPADNGERKAKRCSKCKGLWAPSVVSVKGICPDCRSEDHVRAALTPYPGIVPQFGGDPRGAAIVLRMPDGYNNSWGGGGLCVPQGDR